MLDAVGNSPGTLLLTVLTTLNPPDRRARRQHADLMTTRCLAAILSADVVGCSRRTCEVRTR